MKITKEGTIPTTIVRFCCLNCGCIFECDKDEYEYHFNQREGDYCEAKCPTCGEKVYANGIR